MAFQPVPNVAQLRIEGRVDSQLTINNTYWAISGGGITPVNLLTIAGNLANWVVASLVPLISENWLATRVVGIDLSTEAGFVVEVPTGVPGDVAAEAVPNNVAACVSFRSGVAGRSFRGRNYVAGIPNNQVTLNSIDPALIVSLVGAYDSLKGAGTFAAGWEWSVVSRYAAGVARPAGIATPITSVLMTTPYVRSMRSREIGHGA